MVRKFVSLRIDTHQDWSVHDDDGKARYTRLSLRCGLRYLYDWSYDSSLIYKSRDSSCSLSNLDEDSHPAPSPVLSLERPDLPLQSEGYPFDFQVWNSLFISDMILTYHCMSERSERYTLTDNDNISLVGVRV